MNCTEGNVVTFCPLKNLHIDKDSLIFCPLLIVDMRDNRWILSPDEDSYSLDSRKKIILANVTAFFPSKYMSWFCRVSFHLWSICQKYYSSKYIHFVNGCQMSDFLFTWQTNCLCVVALMRGNIIIQVRLRKRPLNQSETCVHVFELHSEYMCFSPKCSQTFFLIVILFPLLD